MSENAEYWWFVVLAWLPIYAVIYLVPRGWPIGTALSWREWRIEHAAAAMSPPDSAGDSRAEFVALVDTLISIIAGLVVIAQWIAVLLPSPCY